jgi:formamidase
MTRLLTVVGAQLRPVPWDPDATLAKFGREVRMLRASFPDALLYVFPELYLSGEDPFTPAPPGWMRADAQPIPGPLTREVGRIAKRAERWIVAGSVFERDADRTYNTAIVFSPSGRLVARYRKVFPWEPFEHVDRGPRRPRSSRSRGWARSG